MHAMILAAGRGLRMRPLSDRRPKPLLRAGGRSLLEYHLRSLASAGIDEIVINTSWLAGQIHRAIGDGGEFGVRVRFSDEDTPALETGGGIARALPLLGDAPFLVVNGDIWTDYPFAQLPPLAPGDLAHLVLIANPSHNPDGDFGLADKRLGNEMQGRHTFAGIAVYRPEFFAGKTGAFALAPLLRDACASDLVSGELFDGRWWDVGTPDRLARLDGWLRGADSAPA